VVPITVGSINLSQEAKVGKVLAECLANPENILIISSDFCHWGSRFRYQFRLDTSSPIHKSIESLDRQGMQLIEAKDHKGFSEYLSTYRNTICGRHPIGILLGTIASLGDRDRYSVQFIHYEQSSQCLSMDDSSVSYAAAVVTVT